MICQYVLGCEPSRLPLNHLVHLLSKLVELTCKSQVQGTNECLVTIQR